MSTNKPEFGVLQVQIAAGAVVAAPAIYAIVLILLHACADLSEAQLEEGFVRVLNWVFMPLAAIEGAASYVMRGPLLRTPARTGNPLEVKLRATLVCMALAEAPAVMGLVLGLLSPRLNVALPLIGAGLAAALFHFPTRAWLEEPLTEELSDE